MVPCHMEALRYAHFQFFGVLLRCATIGFPVVKKKVFLFLVKKMKFAGIVQAPVFKPTEEEFTDPSEYVAKIR
jgi:hypothetical protein